ncbi:MAG TPA: 50S ribosomal protein L28 [Candidatus Paceibacterota bacterium]
MTKTCAICSKGNNSAGGYSNRVRATKFNPTGTRIQKPNLQKSKNTKGETILICTRCLKKGKNLTLAK